MKKFKNLIREQLNNVQKISGKTITYYDLFPLLKGLENERPGIEKRVWDFLKDEWDIQFQPINNRILCINLFYFGVGEHYPLKYIKEYPKEIEHWKKIHPENFIEGSEENELQKDFNLIWYVYEDELEDIEAFPIMPNW